MAAGLADWKDLLVLALYFAFVLAVGIMSSCRKGRETVKGYFLAGRSIIWLPIGFSLFASNIGSEHFIGLAGSGASSGIAVVAFEWGAVLCLLLLGWVFLPVYLISGIYTMPEYLQRRFGGSRLRLYLSVIATVLYIATKISVDVYAGAIFIQQAIGWNTYLSIAVLLVVTGIYTVVGGLAAVIFTDTFQTVVMLVGSIFLAVLAYIKVGGLMALQYKYMEAIPSSYVANSTCGLPRHDAFHILRDAVDADLPWPGVIIRSTFVALWYWCTDQVIVQRALAAKNIAHARAGTIIAGYLKLLPLFIIILPGMISRVLYTDEVACIDPVKCKEICDNPSGCSNIAYPKLVLELAPTGVKGLMLAVMMSALMSSLTSIFNSAATLFTMDIWTKIRKKASEKELLIMGRVFVVALVGVSIGWVPLIKSAQGAQLFIYIQAVTGYIAPPICSVFLLAVFVPRINEQGAFWGVLIGQTIGLVRLILDFVYPKPSCGEKDSRPVVLSAVNFTYFSAILLGLSAFLAVLISLCTAKPEPEMLKGLTFWSVKRMEKKQNRMVARTKSGVGENKDKDIGEVEYAEVGYNKRTSRMSDTAKEIHKISYNNKTGTEPAGYKSKTEAGYRPGTDAEYKPGTEARYQGTEDGYSIDSDITRIPKDDTMTDLYKQKMTISTRMSMFLNFNAIILLCVFIVCYAIFA